MSATVEKILKEVKNLSSQERQELWERVAAEESQNLDEWEKQVERDSNAGKLDHLLAELKEDIKVGRVKPLNEVINEP
jgi:tRNA A37 methylthiotransferase MiaB